MFEGLLVFLRFAVWLIPGVLAFMAVRSFFPNRFAKTNPTSSPQESSRRARVGIGLTIAALLVAVLVKPFPVGLVVVVLGALAGFGGGRNPKYIRDRELLEKQFSDIHKNQ